jgi:23S rRNA pseudouridine1911/1915/1917 synthase
MAQSGASSSELKPLLEWLLLRYPDTPKTRAQQWVTGGRVSVGGTVIRRPQEPIPDPGATLELLDRHAASVNLDSPREIHPRVALLHLDGSLAVVNKGPGLISIPGPTSDEISALSILADYVAGRLQPRNRAAAARVLPAALRRLRPLPVHRLDKYTSGAFCMAMNPRARQRLVEQLRAGKIRREYIAFVEGRSARPRGNWRHWLELSHDELVQRIVSGPQASASGIAAEAVTHYEVVAEYRVPGTHAIISKLRLRLETGLRHQIRVQAAAEGVPLLGDRKYNPHYQQAHPPEGLPSFSRQALHAAVLGLAHPDRPGQEMVWKAELPGDLRELEEALGKRAH